MMVRHGLTAFVLMAGMGAALAQHTGVQVRVKTGNDDLRSDSRAWVDVTTRAGTISAPLNSPGERLADRTTKSVTLAFPTTTSERDIWRVGIRYEAGRNAFGSDEWEVESVSLHPAGRPGAALLSMNQFGLKFSKSGNWISPYLPKAVSTESINPGELMVDLHLGGDGYRPTSHVIIEVETDDGLFWRGRNNAGQLDRTPTRTGRPTADARERILVHRIRCIRIGFEGGGLPGAAATYDSGDDLELDGITVRYPTPAGDKVLTSFPHVKHKFVNGGWWQSPVFRPFAKLPGEPIQALRYTIYNGLDDLRRAGGLTPAQDQHYNSRTDISFQIPFYDLRAYPSWFMNGKWAQDGLASRGRSGLWQDRDEFPQGVTGSFGRWATFGKTYTVQGPATIRSSDLLNIQLKFKQGQGGNTLPTKSSGGGIVGDLRAADRWDFQGLIVEYQDKAGKWRRLFSDLAINRTLASDGALWRSRLLDTFVIRKPGG